MNIAVIGPGAMGLLYAARLSENANVSLIGNNSVNIDAINKNKVRLKYNGQTTVHDIPTFLSGTLNEKQDLVIIFTKAYVTEQALSENKNILGENTYVLTLQNGCGHGEVIKKFVKEENILIGTTKEGSKRENAFTVENTGRGETAFGTFNGEKLSCGEEIADVFSKSDMPCKYTDNIKQMIWDKLMINASSSVLTGVLQQNQGFIAENEYAFDLCKKLVEEICEAAAEEGCVFDKEEQKERLYNHLKNAPQGYTSIYFDIKEGRKTEAEYISGYVVKTALKHNKTLPVSQTVLSLVHAMEGR